MRYYLIAFIMILLDQISKWMIINYLEIGDRISVIGDFFQITSHRNKGAAFGILQNKQLFFIIITIIIVVMVIWFLEQSKKENRPVLCVALSLILGGAIGNFIDRVRMGEVVDFLSFNFKFTLFGFEVDYPFAIFNIADSAIVVGAILAAVITFFSVKKGEV
ncbi:signal peptidase II [Chengkuizengella marina]|uniref:Lipoprotein signal peptidase n=1 Tax=Chengkuizengella marina TaxID=2507566 RepID=A0A6N9Q3U1_9BACL|nr:signal peptidase II [Chengkuizengella marina]NBI29440.1 signal peptidase II [Chengkuizengella marina]